MNTNTKATAQAKANTTTATAFETVKRNYETALAQGKDTAQELTALATAVAYSVINKCIDPQRKTAAQRDTASNTGFNPAMVSLKRGIAATAKVVLTENTPFAACPAVSISVRTKVPHIGTMKQHPFKRFTGLCGKPSKIPAPSRQTPATGIAI